MLTTTFLQNYNTNMQQMDQLQEKLSSGKNLNKPSDDPVGVVTALRLRSTLSENDKFTDNIDSGTAWLETTDQSLNQAGNLLQRVRELVIQGANDTLPPESRDAISKEIDQLRQQLVMVANSTHDGRYIFAGYKTTTPPFGVSGVYGGDPAIVYNGDAGTINYEIGINAKMQVNVTGDAPFTSIANVFNVLTDIKNDVKAGNTTNLSNTRLGQLDNILNNILSIRSDVGAKENRLELTKTRLEDTKANYSSLLSKTEDVDMAKTITELNMQENIYRTSLAAGAKIIQPSLMDFLR